MNPVVFILPEGATIGGVTSWAGALGGALAARGRDVTLLVHGGSPGHASVPLNEAAGVRMEHIDDLPTPRDLAGSLDRVTAAYSRAADAAATRTGAQALLIPTRDADCFAACAMVAADGNARLVGWRHSPMPYEAAIFARYGAFMARMIGVSRWLSGELRSQSPALASRVGLVANGVAVPEDCPARNSRTDEPLRLIYTGRLDEPVKRVSALVSLSVALSQRGLPHRLTIVGDGPARDSLLAAAADNQSIHFAGAVGPAQVSALLSEHDVFVLGSRIEGLSLAALEAMAAGCALALTHTDSGAADLVGSGDAGELARVAHDASGEETGESLADAVERVVERGVRDIGRAAHARARRSFSIEAMAAAAGRELDLAASAAPPDIREVRPFHDPHRPGSVPPDAPERLARVLASIGRASVVVHGLGAHTMALAETIAADRRIVAIADDDPARHGGLWLGRPVIAPEHARTTGATHVVISSWLHESSIWARRAVYERQGMRVWRLYASPGVREAG